MTFAPTGIFRFASSGNLTVSNQGTGNLLVVEVANYSNSTVWCTALSGGGATWTQAGVKFSGTTNPFASSVFIGTVTATGAGTVTPTWSGTAPATFEIDAHEFTSTVGSWSFITQGNLDSTGTNTWPSLNAQAGDLYFGGGSGTASTGAVAGSTSGYTYNVNANNDGCAFNANCAGGATAPVWGDTNELLVIAVLIRESSSSLPQAAPEPGPLQPPGWFPGADRVTTVPDGIPFYVQPPPVIDPGTPLAPPPTPPASPLQAPLLPPGWFPGADAAATEPDGIPFWQAPQPEAAPPVVSTLPPQPPWPPYAPIAPYWFPGASAQTAAPDGIPFFVQPMPDSSTPLPSPATPYISHIAGSGTAGYFADQNGNPRILRAEQAWALAFNAGRWTGGAWQADMVGYFSARAAQGYTAWYGVAWGQSHVDATTQTFGRTWDGIYPFSINGTPGPISAGTLTLNNAFWTRIDYLFSTALQNGIACFLNLGMAYDFGASNVWANVTSAQEQAFGAALAARYPQAANPNVFWFFGDDNNAGNNGADFAAILAGITGAGDTRGVIALEQYPETNCHVEFDTQAVFDPGGFGVTSATYNYVYTYNPVYLGVEDSYTETGTTPIPAVWGDGPYYGDNPPNSDYTLRRFTWWALASGARGFNSTSENIWTWASGALAAVTSDPAGPWSTSTGGAVTSYFTGLAGWQKLVPDTGSVFITAGRGTRATPAPPGFGAPNYGDTDNYVTGSITPDGTLAVIYCGQHFSVTVNQAKLGTGYTATWVDPSSLATQVATTGSTYNSTPLGNNSAGNPDWALVFQAPPVQPATAPGVPGWIPQPPGWFPGADRVTAIPGGIPFTQVPPPADQNAPAPAPAVTASAGLATGTGAAQSPAVAIGANDALATGTGTAQGDDVSASFTPAVAANAGLATGTGAAQSPVVALGVNDTLATGTGAAQSPVAAIGANDSAGPALGTGTSQAPVAAVAVNAGLASATGTAQQPQALLAYPLAPEYPVIPLPPGWFPGADTVTTEPGGLPFYAQPGPADPGAILTTAGTGPAGLAAGIGTAQSPAAAIGANDSAGPALAAGTSQAPASAIAANAGLAAAAGTAQSPAVALAVSAGLATGTGTAQSPAAAEGVNAGLAAGTGTAQAPAAALGANDAAGPAPGTGASQAPVPAIAVNAGLATATGIAWQAATTQPAPASTFVPLPVVPGWFPGADAVTTEPGGIPFLVQPQPADQNAALGGAPLAVNAGLASAAGTAQAPAVAIAPNAALAAATGAAQAAAAAIGANDAAGPALGTGTALAPLTADGANAGLAAGTGTAQQPSAAIAVTAGLATATGTAQQPVPALGANDATGPAAAAGTSQAPVIAIAVNDVTGPALGTGTAQPVSTATPAPPPPGPVVLLPPGWFPGSDRATTEPDGIPFWQAPQPADPVGAVPAVTVTAGLATATGMAQQPSAAIAAVAAQATGTAAAQPPAAGVSANAGLATVTGSALAALAAAGANALLAGGTGIAQPTAFDYANARVATATGTALQPLVTVAAAVVKGSSTATVTEQAGMSAAVTEAAGMSATVTAPASSKPGVS